MSTQHQPRSPRTTVPPPEPTGLTPALERNIRALHRRRQTEAAEARRADRLAADAATRAGEWVVTHGEPHAGNVIRTSDGRRVLVDWDTVALAPAERDLWMLFPHASDALELYRQRVDQAALDFFRLAWDLKDLAEYLNVLRAPHEENEDTLRQYGALVRLGSRA